MNTGKTGDEKEHQDTNFSFPCGDFQKMAEMMEDCCLHESDAKDCCSIMRRMMGRDQGGQAKKEQETKAEKTV